MDAIPSIALGVLLGAATISLLVFAHEGGHFLAARACGVRVTELGLGLPCRYGLRHRSKRSGTELRVTPLLLGGYARICGMDELESPYAAAALSVVHQCGRMSIEELTSALAISKDDALDACMELEGWGSLASEDGAASGSTATFVAVPRDAAGSTIYDGENFDRACATSWGESWSPPRDGREFLAQERTHVYAGKGFWQRALILTAGVAVNLMLGLALLTATYAVLGVASEQNVIGSVEAGSPAETAGLVAGDIILSIDGIETPTWDAIQAVQQSLDPAAAIEVEYERNGVSTVVAVALDEDGYLGIQAVLEHPGLGICFAEALAFLAETAKTLVSLFIRGSGTVLGDVSSVDEIFQTVGLAANKGPHFYLEVVAALSFSLGLLNLLPLPPLDGGRLAVEIVQQVTGRKLSARVRTILTFVGVLLIVVLCALALVAR